MPERILLVTSTGLPPERVPEIAAVAPGFDFVTCPDNAEAIAATIPGCVAMIGCPRHIWSDALLEKAGPSLRWIHSLGAGIEPFITPGLQQSPLVMSNGKIIQGPEVADHALALLLTLTRNLHVVLRSSEPKPAMSRPIELRGKTMLVLGIGGIGHLVAERAQAFGMTIIGVDADYVPMSSVYSETALFDDLLGLLPRADVVVCAAPCTRETEQFLNEAAFAAMKKGVYFINVSRGRVVKTAALLEAVQSGHVGAVGLDVSDPEPLPADHPLRALPNVVVTPHIAGLSEHNRERSFQLVKLNVGRFATGRPLVNVIDKQQGF